MFVIEFSLWTVFTLIVAVIAAQLVGMLWYSTTIGFGKKWMSEVGLTAERASSTGFKKKQGKAMVFGPLLTLVLAYGLAVMLDNLIVMSIASALKTAAFMWFVLIVPTVGLNYLYNPNLSQRLFVIDILHHLISMLVMSWVIISMI
jgi:hypothetical protein